jgi:hypothetical protein
MNNNDLVKQSRQAAKHCGKNFLKNSFSYLRMTVPLALRRLQADQAAVWLSHSAPLLRRGTLHSYGSLHLISPTLKMPRIFLSSGPQPKR